MATILVAASPAPREVLERVLEGHELVCAKTMTQAESFLQKRTFDLIICTMVFDESRMFDFLRLAKSKTEWRRIPFVCARVRAQVLQSPLAVEAVDFTCRALGAATFLDIAAFGANPEGKMRKAIEQILAGKIVSDRG
jgi:CheY-like chemotaxis protein